jgi:bifunctional non-homologous end joining protein LigD
MWENSTNRVLYHTGFGTGDLLAYYKAMADALLPHLIGRPISFRRFPATVDDESYWEKDAPAFTPTWVKTVAVPRTGGGPDLHYILVEDERTLAWAANVGCIEIHPFLHHYPEITRPTSIVFDLDPGEGAGLVECCTTALFLQDFFARYKLQLFAKVSGAKGMQVYLPLNTPTTYAATQTFGRLVAEELTKKHAKLVVSESTKTARSKKVLIDWAQNSQQKSNVAVYSMRAGGEPLVSMPLEWSEIEAVASTGDVQALKFAPDVTVVRIQKRGDLFAPVLTLHQELPQELLRNWKIVSAPANLVSLTRQRSLENAPRSSAQGGRRQFIVYSPAKQQQNLALEGADEFRVWRLAAPLQTSDQRAIQASETNSQPDIRRLDVPFWDHGTYELIEGTSGSGQMRVYFSGQKIKGEWLFSRQKGDWMIAPVRAADEQVCRSSEAPQLTRVEISPTVQPPPVLAARHRFNLTSLPKGEPRFFEPMEADEVDRPENLPTDRTEWLYEIKWDGYRAIAAKKNEKVHMYGRSGKPLVNCRHEHLDRALAESKFADGVLDGEVVAFQNGIASFQTLQNSLRNNAPVLFVVFDILNYDGHDLTPLSYVERRAFLSKVEPLLPSLFPISESIDADIFELLKTLEHKKIEGVVAKRREAYYRPGKTSHGWVKYWIGELGEFVIAGYMPGRDRHFEALAVGEYIDGKLVYREQIRHGFSIADKDAVFDAIKDDEIAKCPFANLPQKKRRGAVDELRMDQYIWVKPKLRCLMRYKERTAAGEIREHGKFIKLLEREAA